MDEGVLLLCKFYGSVFLHLMILIRSLEEYVLTENRFEKVHTCGLFLVERGTKKLKYTDIGLIIGGHVRANSNVTAVGIVSHLNTCYGVDVNYKKAWKGLELAKERIYGDALQSFNMLKSYVQASLSTNPGSHIVLDVDNVSRRFCRLFVLFNACIHGFKSCRPILFVDGMF